MPMNSSSMDSLVRAPGPSGLPIVGSMLQWDGPHTNLEWTKKYGPVYQVKMGNKCIVSLNSLDMVIKHMEGRKGELFLDRPMGPAAIAQGLLFGSGDPWKNNKKAFMRALHTETFTKHMIASIMSEMTLVIHEIDKKCGKSLKIGDIFLPACANTIAGLLIGGSLQTNSEDRKKLLNIAKSLECIDLNSKRTQICLKHPKLREPLSKLTFKHLVDVHGTHRRLQILIRQWIRHARNNTWSNVPFSTHKRIIKHDPSSSSSNSSDETDDVEVQEPPAGLHKRIIQHDQNSSSSNSSGDKEPPAKCPHLDEVKFGDEASNSEETSQNIQMANELPLIKSTDEGTLDITMRPKLKVHFEASDNDRTLQTRRVSKLFPSDDDVMMPPEDEKTIEAVMRQSSFLAAFGFADTAEGELAYEFPLESVEETPETPITEFTWSFNRAMSVNFQENSILQRILNQPEFIHMKEDNDEELLQSLIDMFFGGITSTLAAIEFILMYLTQNPEMQTHAQKEIDREAGRENNGDILWSLRDKMPYVQACITEALRLGSVTPSSLPHVAKEDTEIEGYHVAKGTFVVASIYSLHHDSGHYLDPHDFRPQRHMYDGIFHSPESFRPYGVGARRCVGDKIADMQLFLSTVCILQHYTLTPVDNKKNETHMRIVHRLKNFKCKLSKRSFPSK